MKEALDTAKKPAGGTGGRWMGKRPMALALLCLILGSTVGAGILVYSSDTYYFGDRTNLVLNIPDVLVSGTSTPFIIATEDRDGNARPDSPVRISLDQGLGRKTIFEGQTDSSGMLTANVEVPATRGDAVLVVEAGGETITREVSIVNASGSPKARVYLSTDKPLYQPGQTIHMRTLCFGGADFMASPGPVVLQVTDPNKDRIFRKSLKADEYGIASYDFPLSDQLPLGSYVIRASLSDTVYTELPVVVKRYALPKFQIGLDGLRPWYHIADQTLSAKVNATYTFGKPVNGTVTVVAAVKGETVIRSEWYHRYNPPSGLVFNKTLDLVDGLASLSFPIQVQTYRDMDSSSPYDNLEYTAYTLVINVTVRDTAGHKELESYEVQVVQTPYRPVILADSFMTGAPARLFIMVIDPDGAPVPNATVTLRYSHSDRKTPQELINATDSRGVVSMVMNYEGEGSVSVGISAKENGINRTSSYNYYISGNARLKVDGEDRSFRPGETASFEVRYEPGDGMPNSGTVFCQVESEGIVVTGGSVRVEDGRGTISFVASGLMAPCAELRVFKTLPDGAAVQDAVLFSVEKPLELSVAISPQAQTQRPGGAIGLDFSVSDPNGDLGGAAALGVKIVDLSVYELGQRVLSEDELFHGLRSSSRGARYDLALYFNDPSASAPSIEGVVYERTQTAGVSVFSTYSDYMASAKDRKDDLIGSYWTLLGLGGFAALLFLVARGSRRKLRGRLNRSPRTDLAAIIFSVFVASIVVGMSTMIALQNGLLSSTEEDRGQGTLSQNTQSNRPKASPASASGFSPFGFLPSSGDSSSTSRPSSTGFMEVQRKTSIREDFPETWYWNPVLITDASGKAHLDLEAPDTLTTWGVDAAASTKDGRFGMGQANITVFQEFFVEPDLPAYLVRNDTLRLPVLVYNYLGENRTVEVIMSQSPWFDLSGPANATIEVPANSSLSVKFNITALQVGAHDLTVEGRTGIYQDIVTREMVVLPDGKLVTKVFNGELNGADGGTHTIDQSPLRVNGSANAYLKLVGSMAGVALDGADSFIQFAFGCGEQSTSVFTVDLAAYRNLQLYGGEPSKLAQVEKYILQAIQYEAQFLTHSGGGRAICWHPGEPADMWLTAWAVFAYKDASNAGFDIDTRILDGFRTYLLSVQRSDGSWSFPDIGHWSINNELQNKDAVSTAYVLRSLQYAGQPLDQNVKRGLEYLAAHIDLSENAYGLSLALLALSSYKSHSDLQDKIVARLLELKNEDNVKGTVWWEMGDHPGSSYYSRREGGSVETTAYAALGLAAYKGHTSLVAKALSYLLSIRDNGRWHNTHSTAVALQALNLEGAFTAKDMTVSVIAGGADAGTTHITTDNNDLVFYTDLRPYLEPDDSTEVVISSNGEGTVLYQLIYQENLPWDLFPDEPTGLLLQVTPRQTRLTVQGSTAVDVNLRYIGNRSQLRMVLVEFPLAAGFRHDPNELEDLVPLGMINAFELSNGRILRFYIDDLKRDAEVSFSFHFTAGMEGIIAMQGVRAYDMYEPDRSVTVDPIGFIVGRD